MMDARHSAAALGPTAFFRFLSGKTERKGTPHQRKQERKLRVSYLPQDR